ncbi:MAG: CinA family protein [Alcanivorax sp.]
MDNLVDELSQLLSNAEVKLVTAESCTGGMVSTAITERAGSSKIFDRGYVTYSNQSKEELLGVPVTILNNYGAVSAQCADSMVLGALEKSNADVGLSITGIAGPDGGDNNKPVGLVYIGVVVTGREPVVTECHFQGDRAAIRRSACEKALTLLVETARTI